MRARTTVAAGVVMLVVAGTLGCDLLNTDPCEEAKKHLCSKLPGMGCSTMFMDDAVAKVRGECGDEDANKFFQRAMSQCKSGTGCTTD